jgi:excisionase family DNA binding protein
MCPKANLNPKTTTTATAAASATQTDDAYIQPLSNFIGAAEAARVLGVARKTVVRWAKSGRLRPHVLRVGQRGHHWRFDRRALLCDVGGPTTTTASSSSTEEEEGSAKAESAPKVLIRGECYPPGAPQGASKGIGHFGHILIAGMKPPEPLTQWASARVSSSPPPPHHTNAVGRPAPWGWRPRSSARTWAAQEWVEKNRENGPCGTRFPRR